MWVFVVVVFLNMNVKCISAEVVIIEWTPYITMIEHKEQDDAIKYLALSLNSISL